MLAVAAAPPTAEQLLRAIRACYRAWKTTPPSQQAALELQSRTLAAQFVALMRDQRYDQRIARAQQRRLCDPRHDAA